MKELIKELYNENGVFRKDILDELRKNRGGKLVNIY